MSHSRIPEGLFKQNGVRSSDIHVFGVLGLHTDRLGRCRLKTKTICTETGLSQSTVIAGLRRLEQWGWIEVINVFAVGRRGVHRLPAIFHTHAEPTPRESPQRRSIILDSNGDGKTWVARIDGQTIEQGVVNGALLKDVVPVEAVKNPGTPTIESSVPPTENPCTPTLKSRVPYTENPSVYELIGSNAFVFEPVFSNGGDGPPIRNRFQNQNPIRDGGEAAGLVTPSQVSGADPVADYWAGAYREVMGVGYLFSEGDRRVLHRLVTQWGAEAVKRATDGLLRGPDPFHRQNADLSYLERRFNVFHAVGASAKVCHVDYNR